jgi:hypothetical protein
MDGVTLCDSVQESKIANWLYLNGITFEAHKKLPKPSRQKCDFYLPDYQLWVEWDGLMAVRQLSSDHADLRADRKVSFYKSHGMKFVVLNRENNWESLLHEAIFLS